MSEIKQEWFSKDYYKTLEVSPDATDEELTKAYRRLARKHHPDANSGDTSVAERFKEVASAYETLGDAKRRAQYDEVRAMAASGMPFGSAGPGGSHSFQFSAGSGIGDLLNEFLSGNPSNMNFGGGAGMRIPVRGHDLQARVTLTFEESIDGATLPVWVADGRKINVRVPPGITDGKQIRVRGKGSPGSDGGPHGDLYVTAGVKPHRLFGRDGNDLTLSVPVSFSEAAMGAKIMVPTYEGKPVSLRLPAGTQPGQVLRVRGRGLRLKNAKGDLLVTVEVVVPSKLNPAQRRALEAFATASNGTDLREHLQL